jgi:hypothetical protein
VRSVVQIHLGPPFLGAVAQLGEHLVCNQGVAGSIPASSTNTALFALKSPSGHSGGWSLGGVIDATAGFEPEFIDNRRY